MSNSSSSIEFPDSEQKSGDSNTSEGTFDILADIRLDTSEEATDKELARILNDVTSGLPNVFEECFHLQRRVQQLIQQLRECGITHNEAVDKYNTVLKITKQLEADNKALKLENKNLLESDKNESALEALKADIEKMKKELQASKADYAKKLNDLNVENAKMKNQLQASNEKALEASKAENAKMKNQLETLKNEHAKALKVLKKELNNARSRRDKFKTFSVTQAANIAVLKEKYKGSLENSKVEKALSTKRYGALQNENAKLNEQLKNATLNEQLEKYKVGYAKLNEQLKNYKVGYAKLNEQLEKYKVGYAKLKSESPNIKTENENDNIKALEAMLRDKDEKIRQLIEEKERIIANLKEGYDLLYQKLKVGHKQEINRLNEHRIQEINRLKEYYIQMMIDIQDEITDGIIDQSEIEHEIERKRKRIEIDHECKKLKTH